MNTGGRGIRSGLGTCSCNDMMQCTCGPVSFRKAGNGGGNANGVNGYGGGGSKDGRDRSKSNRDREREAVVSDARKGWFRVVNKPDIHVQGVDSPSGEILDGGCAAESNAHYRGSTIFHVRQSLDTSFQYFFSGVTMAIAGRNEPSLKKIQAAVCGRMIRRFVVARNSSANASSK